MAEFTYQYRSIDWNTNPPSIEQLTFEEYYLRLAGTRAADKDKNCPARCWLRAMDAKRAEELGI